MARAMIKEVRMSLLPGQSDVGGGMLFTSRYWAAEVLRRVAQLGEVGHFPDDVTLEDLGRALHRICINAPEEDPLIALLRGWRIRERER